MLLTETEQTETLFAMAFFGLVAIAGITLLITVIIDNAL
jgi:SNF family Na+-dependent transporter